MRCLLLLAVFGSLCGWYSASELDIKSVLEDVPFDQRKEFLQYYFQRGYELAESQIVDLTAQHTMAMQDLPDEFAVSLYRYIQTLDIVCFDDGTCIEIGDIGVYPKL